VVLSVPLPRVSRLRTCEQRCWWHKIGNVLAALPKSVHAGTKKALGEIYNAEDREHAEKAAQAFANDYGAKWPKATAKITDDLDVLLAFYDYPAEHWVHLRTTNPIVILSCVAGPDNDRVDLRDRAPAAASDQGTRLAGRRHRDGVQAHRVSPDPLASGERAPPRRPRQSRSPLREGQAGRASSYEGGRPAT
jgi:hypothetical protein